MLRFVTYFFQLIHEVPVVMSKPATLIVLNPKLPTKNEWWIPKRTTSYSLCPFAARLTSLIFQQHNNGFTNEFSERNDKAKPKALKLEVGRNPLIENIDPTAS